MKKDLKAILFVTTILMLSSCSVRDAAILATVPGHMLGVPLGMTLTAIDETIETAGEVIDANPRYDHRNRVRHVGGITSQRKTYDAPGPHYYKAEVLVKTRGPAKIQSMQLIDSHDVTEFWR